MQLQSNPNFEIDGKSRETLHDPACRLHKVGGGGWPQDLRKFRNQGLYTGNYNIKSIKIINRGEKLKYIVRRLRISTPAEAVIMTGNIFRAEFHDENFQ